MPFSNCAVFKSCHFQIMPFFNCVVFKLCSLCNMRRAILRAHLHTRANCPRHANHCTCKTKNLPQNFFLNCLCFEFQRNTDPTVRYFLRISAKISAMLTGRIARHGMRKVIKACEMPHAAYFHITKTDCAIFISLLMRHLNINMFQGFQARELPGTASKIF